MDLDSFLISILFDNAKTQDSAKKIENTVNGLKDKIVGAFSAILSIDFLKNAIESSLNLATKFDNLSYATNVSKENLSAWGEAVKRNGGTVESLYSSVSNLSSKIMEMQVNFGSAGQLVFARLGISLQDSNGQMKDAVDVLGELGDKFKSLPKAFQFTLGHQLGLDNATIRLISSGSEEALKLVDNMKKLSGINELNTEKNIKLRNSLYDIYLIWESMKIGLANSLIPIVQKFSELLVKSMGFLQEHGKVVRSLLLILAALLAGIVLSSIISVTRAFVVLGTTMLLNPASLIAVGILALVLVLQDLKTWLDGNNSALGEFYEWLSESKLGKSIKYIIGLMDTLTKKVRDFFGIKQKDDNLLKLAEEQRKGLAGEETKNQPTTEITPTRKEVIEKITKISTELGVNPNVSATIANIESGFNQNAKSKSSSAGGYFQLTDATAISNGLTDLSKKLNAQENIKAGINNLKKITEGLTGYFGRAPNGAETYLGERTGLAGSKKVFSANPNTMLSSLFNEGVLKANPSFRTMTAGQLINESNKTYAQKSVVVGEINISAPNSDAKQIAKHAKVEIQKEFTKLVTNIDNGVKL